MVRTLSNILKKLIQYVRCVTEPHVVLEDSSILPFLRALYSFPVTVRSVQSF